jgi:hypothetical protein
MTPCQLVREYYPKSQVIKVGKLYEIWTSAHSPIHARTNVLLQSRYMGKGQSKKAAWKSAYRNFIR